jgi:hypothetical protein
MFSSFCLMTLLNPCYNLTSYRRHVRHFDGGKISEHLEGITNTLSRSYAKSRRVAGSSLNEVIEFFQFT